MGTQATICRACAAGCGILVEFDGAQILRVQGDVDHPLSRGYLCEKGHAIPTAHHDGDRLDRPLLYGEPTSWATCLDDLAGRLLNVLNTHGPEGVGVFTATGGGGLDSLGKWALNRLIDQLGTSQRFTPTTIDMAPAYRAAELVTGSPYELLPVWIPEDDESTLVVFVGCNPALSHGYFTILPAAPRRIRAFRQRGGQVWVLDPRRTKTADIADGHLAPRPGTDGAVLAWLVREVLRNGVPTRVAQCTTAEDRDRLADALIAFDRATVADVTGIEEAQLERLLAAVRTAGHLAVVTGTGVTFGPHALVTEWLRWALLIVTGSLDVPGGMWFNPGWLSPLEQRETWVHAPSSGDLSGRPASRPDLFRITNEQPCSAMVDEIEAGTLRALLVVGGSPLTSFPEPDRTLAALTSLEALAVIDIRATPLTALASHVLPAAAQMERSDLLSFNGRTCVAPAVVDPAAERRRSWWIHGQLAQRLGLDILDGLDVDELEENDIVRKLCSRGRRSADSLLEAGSRGFEPPRLYDWVRRALPEGRWRLAPPALVGRLPRLLDPPVGARPFLLVSRRDATHLNSVRYADGRRALTIVQIHPDDAAELRIADGDEVEIESDAGAMRGTVRLDDGIRRGVVSASHGRFETNTARLVSGRPGKVDPLTAQPQMSAIPVSIRSTLVAPLPPPPAGRRDETAGAPEDLPANRFA